MSLPYGVRFACLCLAAFFLAHTLLATAVSLAARWAVERSSRLRPATAARWLFGLRLLPSATAGLLVSALFAPSYLLLEARGEVERVGVACLVSALLGAALCLSGLTRGLAAAIRSSRRLAQLQRQEAPVVLLAGVRRPRLVVAPAIRNVLTADELAVALRHEEAHRRSKDNLKRLLLSLAPDLFLFAPLLRRLEVAWQRASEWAADDEAVGGSAERAVALASALVRVGRMRANLPSVPLATSLLGDADGLRTRVERLLDGERSYDSCAGATLAGTATVAAAAALAVSTPILPTAYRLLEALAR